MSKVQSAISELASLLDDSLAPVYVLDEDRRIIYCNPACARWIGIRPSELLGERSGAVDGFEKSHVLEFYKLWDLQHSAAKLVEHLVQAEVFVGIEYCLAAVTERVPNNDAKEAGGGIEIKLLIMFVIAVFVTANLRVGVSREPMVQIKYFADSLGEFFVAIERCRFYQPSNVITIPIIAAIDAKHSRRPFVGVVPDAHLFAVVYSPKPDRDLS